MLAHELVQVRGIQQFLVQNPQMNGFMKTNRFELFRLIFDAVGDQANNDHTAIIERGGHCDEGWCNVEKKPEYRTSKTGY